MGDDVRVRDDGAQVGLVLTKVHVLVIDRRGQGCVVGSEEDDQVLELRACRMRSLDNFR